MRGINFDGSGVLTHNRPVNEPVRAWWADAVVWDNRRLMHRATPFDMHEPRRMWHTRIAGDRETELALNMS